MPSRLPVGVRCRTFVLPLAALLLPPLLLWGCGDGDDVPMRTGQTERTDPGGPGDGVSSTRSSMGPSTEEALATPCASRGRSICTPAGDAVLRCDEDGRTTVRALCEAGCRDGACVTACSIDGTVFCRDGDRWRCRTGRSLERIGPCPAGTVCTAGECLPRVCAPGTVSCRNRDEGLACDGSGYREIPFDCGIGFRCEDGLCLEGGRNACGGSAALPARPGTVCGPCGLDTWRCDGPDAMRCDGNTENGCGGCRFFSREIGDLCGQCGTWQCDPADPDRPVCSDPGFNACGTCGPLDGMPGASCGPCGLDALICRDGALTCNGETTNACGGCSTLPDLLGEACGTCATGAFVCDGDDFLRCAEVPSCTARLLASGRDHLCIVRADDGLVCWGANGDGQLGVGSIATWRPPQPVASAVGPVRTVALGDRHSCAIRTNNTLRCWGANTRGQLGDGSTSTRLQPASQPVLTAVAEVALGDGFTCARLLNGRVRCWGANDRGQLGDGGEEDRTTPGSGSILDQADALVAGARHACALGDGEVHCWGDGARGRLGHGETSLARTPVSVSLPQEAVAIAAGEEHTCALLEGGEVHCWGANTFGQLGADGGDALVPVPVGGLAGVRSLAAGAQHTCAVTSDAVFCFGANDRGQLGISGVASTSTPTAVPGLSGGFEVVAGAEHSCGLRDDGTLTCWGSNRRGQRGKAPEPGPFAPSPLRF